MRIDLHTHSRVSDGTATPTELVHAAAAAGLDVLGLTDHDTADGWAEADEAAAQTGIRLVHGIEVSTRHAGSSQHLLAYLPDPGHPELRAELEAILDGRNQRVPRIVARLNDLGIEITVEEVHRLAGEASATGRPHVADVLVARGVVANRDEAFARFLNPGRPAYVDRYAPPLTEMIRVVGEAGGATVLAHPWGRYRGVDAAGIATLKELGLDGIEVDHEDHDAATRARLRALAEELGLIITGSSDYHGTGKTGFELGCNTTDPEQFERLMAVPVSADNLSTAPATCRPASSPTPGTGITVRHDGL